MLGRLDKMIPVIDLFAGPGGLNEGFSSLRTAENQPIFKTIMSVERDSIAHRTLRLRAFFRQIMQGRETAPTAYVSYMKSPTPENMAKLQQKYSREWAAADYEAVCAELVVNDDALILEGEKRLKEQGVFKGDDWVLIGGPPSRRILSPDDPEEHTMRHWPPMKNKRYTDAIWLLSST